MDSFEILLGIDGNPYSWALFEAFLDLFGFRLVAAFHICRKCFGKFITDFLFLLFLVHVSVRSEDG